MRVKLSYSDGMYGLMPTTEEGPDVYDIRDDVYAAWLVWCQQYAVFDALFTALTNQREVESRLAALEAFTAPRVRDPDSSRVSCADPLHCDLGLYHDGPCKYR